MIKSEGALSYAQAQMRMDDARMTDDLTTSLRTLNALAKKLKAKRSADGALTLASPEVRFVLDSRRRDPTDVGVYELKEANSMVEEFMLLANITVARETTRAFPKCAMPLPPSGADAGAFDGLARSLAQHGHASTRRRRSRSRRRSTSASTRSDPYFNKLARILATRCSRRATL